jgi:hypothetical protein
MWHLFKKVMASHERYVPKWHPNAQNCVCVWKNSCSLLIGCSIKLLLSSFFWYTCECFRQFEEVIMPGKELKGKIQ